MKINLRKKIFTTILLSISICSFIAIYFSFGIINNSFNELENENLNTITTHQTSRVREIFARSKELVNTLAETNCVKTYLQKDSSISYDEFLNTLNSFNIEDNYSAIYIMNKEGITVASTNKSFEGKNYSFRLYFQKAIKNIPYIDMAVGVTSGELGYYFSHPVIVNGEIIGVATLKLKPEIFKQIISINKKSLEGNTFLIQENGIIISSSNDEYLYKIIGNTEEIPPLVKDNFKNIDFNNSRSYLKDYQIIKNNLNDFSFKKNPIFRLENNNNLYIVTQTNDFLNMFIVKEIKYNKFKIFNSSNAVNTIIIISGSALLALALILFFTNKFLIPLNKLMQTISALDKGEIYQVPYMKTGDEIEDLNNALAKMMSKINNNQRKIKKEVENKTKELEKMNEFLVGRELEISRLKENSERNIPSKKRKEENINWSQKFKEASSIEEDVVYKLSNYFIKKINSSTISPSKKRKAIDLLNELISDSKRHDKMFKKLIKKYEK